MRNAKVCLTVTVLLIAKSVHAGTALDFWHSYVHAQTQQRHYCFRLAQYKRGLFWGSCGPSTKSQQWSFYFDLAGDGPVYSIQEISLLDDNGKVLHAVSGKVLTDSKRRRAKIAIEIEAGGSTNSFTGNGEYRIKLKKSP